MKSIEELFGKSGRSVIHSGNIGDPEVEKLINDLSFEYRRLTTMYDRLLEEKQTNDAVSVPDSPLDEALYQCDLMQDEFIRISLLTDNEEIKGLCERAQIRLKTKLSFFERMEKLESKVRKMSVENEALKALLAAITPEIYDWVYCGLHTNGRLDGKERNQFAADMWEAFKKALKEAQELTKKGE